MIRLSQRPLCSRAALIVAVSIVACGDGGVRDTATTAILDTADADGAAETGVVDTLDAVVDDASDSGHRDTDASSPDDASDGGPDDASDGGPDDASDGGPDDASDGGPPVEAGVFSCVAACDGRVCGDDGCGGSCGLCGAGFACDDDGACACVPACGRPDACGQDDGCGGVCATCDDGLGCTTDRCADDGVTCVSEPRRALPPLVVGEVVTASGDTSGGPSDFDGASCGLGSPGPDAEYRFEIPERRAVRFALESAAAAPVLHARDACGDASVACAAGPALGAFFDAGPHHVIVDAADEDDGAAYTLTALLVPHVVGTAAGEVVATPRVSAVELDSWTRDRCPPGHVLVGLAGQLARATDGAGAPTYYAPAMMRVAGLCASYHAGTETGESYVGAADPWSLRMPWRGTERDPDLLGELKLAVCPEGKAVVGIRVKTGQLTAGVHDVPHVRRIVLACAALRPEGDDAGGVTLETRAVSPIPGIGNNSGEPSAILLCPARSVAMGIDTLDSAIVRGVGLVCTQALPAFEEAP